MSRKVLVELEMEPLVRLSDETMSLLRESASTCADCAAILKYLVDVNGVGPALRRDGTTFKVDEQKRHLLELKGLALPKDAVKFLRERAATCREPDGAGCFYCARILDAMTKDGRLREWPHDSKDEQVRMPIESQRVHVMLEVGKRPVWEESK
jgi:hypothetical protein